MVVDLPLLAQVLAIVPNPPPEAPPGMAEPAAQFIGWM